LSLRASNGINPVPPEVCTGNRTSSGKTRPSSGNERRFSLPNLLTFAAGLSIIGSAPAFALASPPEPPAGEAHRIYTVADVQWQDGPSSLPAGAQFALLDGDPSKAGYFALRISLPDGYVIPPHRHPVQERVTVLSGTFHLGHGETVNRQETKALGRGSYFSLPPRMTHFAIAEGETVIQLTSIGPWTIEYVNPSDDPRR
jgi:quercetin dioxygenase-like cupin family protein